LLGEVVPIKQSPLTRHPASVDLARLSVSGPAGHQLVNQAILELECNGPAEGIVAGRVGC